MTDYSYYFAQPWWLLGLLLVVPIIWLACRNLAALSRTRRTLATVLRCLLIIVLIALLARLTRSQKNEQLTVIAVIDRSRSIPAQLQQDALDYLAVALADKAPADQFAVVDIAEIASISKLPSGDTAIRQRNTTLTGEQSRLAQGVQMAMAIAPPDTAVRILLVTDGNETAGDLKEAARIAAVNGIPIDVLPLRYRYDREVIFKRLAAPGTAKSGQTISLRFILNSTIETSGKLFLNLNGRPVDLEPGLAEIAAEVRLKPGTNVKTISLPVGTRGVHEFEAVFVPDNPDEDMIGQNNRASAMTFVAGPGHVLVADSDGIAGPEFARMLQDSGIDSRAILATDLPDNLARLMDTDAVILVNTDCSNFTFAQQEMLVRYVTDLGGGLVMTGGPQSFGAGGWIGSPVADIVPVDFDPPQKKQMPKGALVLIMHACEMPQGNLWGERIALAAVKTLSREDLVGILAYNWQGGSRGDWVFPLSQAGDKTAVNSAIRTMQMGDMPDLGAHLKEAYNKLKDCNAGQKHVIIISDGDPAPPTGQLLSQMKQAGITCTGVAVFPHSPADVQSLLRVAQLTGGRFYDVKDPAKLPQIFIKEAQVVRRSLIVEETFSPQITYSLSEIMKGLSGPLPNLDGYVLTGPKGGLNQILLSSHQGDPILAAGQSGLGRCVAFTSSVDSRWASPWLAWQGRERLFEQMVRWVAKSAQARDCEITADVQGDQVNVNVEAIDNEGKFIRFANIDAQVIAPDMSSRELELDQVGPGQFQGNFQAAGSGSYIVNLRYKKLGADQKVQLKQAPVTVPFAPEFRALSDNASLLTQISSITGGRVLSSDPAAAMLFDYSGVKIPQTQLPLTRPLIFIWLVLFLLDVAVRRIAVDVKALWRKAVSLIRRRPGRDKAGQTLDRLRIVRKKVRDGFASRRAGSVASRRYQADEHYKGDLPVAEIEPTAKPAPKKATGKAEKEKKPAADEQSHIQQLLRAKKKAADRRKDKNQDDDK